MQGYAVLSARPSIIDPLGHQWLIRARLFVLPKVLSMISKYSSYDGSFRYLPSDESALPSATATVTQPHATGSCVCNHPPVRASCRFDPTPANAGAVGRTGNSSGPKHHHSQQPREAASAPSMPRAPQPTHLIRKRCCAVVRKSWRVCSGRTRGRWWWWLGEAW